MVWELSSTLALSLKSSSVPNALCGSEVKPTLDMASKMCLESGKGSAVGWGGTQSPPDVIFWAQNLEPASP